MAEATLSSKNQIVIPREALNLKPGDKLLVRTHAGKILIMEKPKSCHRATLGRGVYPKDYLIKERRSWS